MHRRDFLGLAAGFPIAATEIRASAQRPAASAFTRDLWVVTLGRVADPVLSNLAHGTLRAKMPVEQADGTDRRAVTHLEAFGRLIAGMAPWLELSSVAAAEGQAQSRYRALAQEALANAVDPASPDALNFTRESQPLVDSAFLAQGLLRAPHALADALDQTTKGRLIEALTSTRAITPAFSNWLMFSAMVEAGLKLLGAPWDRLRVDYALRQHDQWYQGDGAYGDGPRFHWDYYNSFVIQPMLLDVLKACGDESQAWSDMRVRVFDRARRYGAILERLVGPDGSFPAIGRSLAYRCGAFHLLAALALSDQLPDGLPPAQARAALAAVIRRTLEAPGTFDANGWLTIGLAGHQPGIGERYISTGSLYLCAVAFLPLGLAADHAFWTGPDMSTTAMRAWSGEEFTIDHAISN
jgi:hypothetical protein